jgi:hypothetical protein
LNWRELSVVCREVVEELFRENNRWWRLKTGRL